MNRRAKTLLVSLPIFFISAAGAVLAAGALVSACTKKEEAAPAPPPPPAAAPAAPGAAAPAAAPAATGTATIKGMVKLAGAPPEMKMLSRDADPFCGRKKMKEEDVLVGPGGGLENVLVRITKGVTGSYP